MVCARLCAVCIYMFAIHLVVICMLDCMLSAIACLLFFFGVTEMLDCVLSVMVCLLFLLYVIGMQHCWLYWYACCTCWRHLYSRMNAVSYWLACTKSHCVQVFQMLISQQSLTTDHSYLGAWEGCLRFHKNRPLGSYPGVGLGNKI